MKLPMSVLASAIGLALGLPLSPTHASMGGGVPAPAWTPAQWFLANEQGIWLDAEDFTRYMSELGPELVDTANTAAAWTPNGANTVVNEDGGVKITFVDFSNGANMTLNAAKGLSTDLTFGKWYVIEFNARVATGNNLTPQILSSAAGTLNFPTLTDTAYQKCRLVFQKGTLAPSVTMATMSAGEMIWVKDMTVRELVTIDTASEYQASNGFDSVLAPEQPVGLAFDKRKQQAPVSLGTTNWTKTAGDGVVTIVGNQITITGATTTTIVRPPARTMRTGQMRLRINVTAFSATSGMMWVAGAPTVVSATGIYRNSLYSTNSNYDEVSIGSGSITFTIEEYSEWEGNHVSQSTAAARWTLSARKNSMLYTEDLTNAAWTKNIVTITANDAVAPDGKTTADRLTVAAGHTAGSAIRVFQGPPVLLGNTYTSSVYYKPGTGVPYVLFGSDTPGGCAVFFNGATGAYHSRIGTDMQPGVSVALPNGWFRLSVTYTATAADASNNQFWSITNRTTTTLGPDPVMTAGSAHWWFWGAQHEPGAVATTYQRVNTATDYDTAGFLHYWKLDGVDDYELVGAFTAGTLTSNMDVFALVRRDSGAGFCLLAPTSNATVYGFGLSGNGNAVIQDAGSGVARTWVNGVELAGGAAVTAGDLHTAMPVGEWHVVELHSVKMDTITDLRIGGTGTGFPLNGAIAEVILAPAQDAAARTKARERLAAKAGITLP